MFSTISIRLAWQKLHKPVAWWLAVSVIAISISPNGWPNLAARAGEFYDAGNYNTIATSGYVTQITAFYPLWPMIVRAITLGTTDRLIFGWVGSLLAVGLFGAAAVVFLQLLERFKALRYERYVAALMILSPLSLFRVLPFTESLFSLLLMLLLWDLTSRDGSGSLFKCALWSLLLSMTRPMFPFLIVAAAMVASFIALFGGEDAVMRRTLYRRLAAVALAAPLGYLPFGMYCQSKFGNFWLPFDIQAEWGRKFGLHWPVILNPTVINGSNEVLVWDLIGFYMPLVLFAWGCFYFIRHRTKPPLAVKVAFFMATLIGCAHSAAAFLTFDRLMSIGRHVLANPLPFLTLAIALQHVPSSPRSELWVRRSLQFVLFASAVFLGMWWYRFAHDRWIG